MKIDLHVHTAERSPCGQSPAVEQVRAAIAQGLDALFICDHDRLAPPDHLAALNRLAQTEAGRPFHIFGGCEVSIGFEHLLVLGVQDALLEETRWTYPNLHRFVRQHHGVLILAHPYRFMPEVSVDVAAYPPDAIEIHSRNIAPDREPRIRALAASLGLPLVSNSDAHHTDHVGAYYNRVEAAPDSEAAWLDCVRAGQLIPAKR